MYYYAPLDENWKWDKPGDKAMIVLQLYLSLQECESWNACQKKAKWNWTIKYVDCLGL